jgi:D-glycero-D-manno-heptose 1,7-bisphosphate phosphatase
MTIKTIFLDRDGVINKEINYLYKIEDFEFTDGIFKACKYFQKLGYKIIIITNQSGIYRGYYSEVDYRKLTKWMVSEFFSQKITILDVFHCPHGPKSPCICRKPEPGMLFEAQKKYKIDMQSSWMIGDKERDIEAANKAGIDQTILLSDENTDSKAQFIIKSVQETEIIISK